MCSGPAGAHPAPVVAASQEGAWAGEVIPLEPVDSVAITTVCDNFIDIWLVDEGPARRLLSRGGPPPVVAAPALEGGKGIGQPHVEHGFSAHVEITKGGVTHRLLFDCGMTPGGCAGNLAMFGLPPGDQEAIVCSHGHFDHTTGFAGLLKALGRASLPVVIHPEFWTRRRIAFPGAPMEVPTTSRRALEEGGFTIIENRRPSFLFDRSALVTGEVDRTTSFEKDSPSTRPTGTERGNRTRSSSMTRRSSSASPARAW